MKIDKYRDLNLLTETESYTYSSNRFIDEFQKAEILSCIMRKEPLYRFQIREQEHIYSTTRLIENTIKEIDRNGHFLFIGISMLLSSIFFLLLFFYTMTLINGSSFFSEYFLYIDISIFLIGAYITNHFYYDKKTHYKILNFVKTHSHTYLQSNSKINIKI